MSNKVWNIPIEGWSMEQIRQEVERRTVQHAWPLWIVTANPEILLYARSHEDYASILRQADVRTVDGFGLQLMLRLSGQSVVRVTGVQLADAFVLFAIDRDWKIGLIGGRDGVAQRAKTKLMECYPAISLAAEQGGTISSDGMDDAAGEEARHRLTLFAPDVLFVAFGHPRQERWIARYLSDFPSLKVVVGVGGTVDFWAQTIRRAPVWMRRLGLEWAWRFLQEPTRLGRILRAVFVFPLLFLFDLARTKK